MTTEPNQSPWNHGRPGNKRIAGPPNEPLSLCPTCWRPGTTIDTGTLREYRCDRGHTWIQTKKRADACGQFMRSYKTTPERNV